MKINNPTPKYCYPIDNSFCICLTDNTIKSPYLAGTKWEDAKMVRIISEPYNEVVNGYGGEREYEFINVLFEGNKYRILNNYNTEFTPAVFDFDYNWGF